MASCTEKYIYDFLKKRFIDTNLKKEIIFKKFKDFGTNAGEPCDYPDMAKTVSEAILSGEYTSGINLYVVPFTEIQEQIHKKCPEEYMITMMRRFMFRIAERLSLKLGSQAIITGESLGQVASQTIESMTVVSEVVKNTPIIRPLVAFDKYEISIGCKTNIDNIKKSIEN